MLQFLNFSPLSPQICDSAGGILIFMYLGAQAKILNPTTTPSGILLMAAGESESGIIHKIVAYLSLLCWSHALHSDQHSIGQPWSNPKTSLPSVLDEAKKHAFKTVLVKVDNCSMIASAKLRSTTATCE